MKRLLTLLLVLVAGPWLTPPAHGFGANECAADRFYGATSTSTLNCTANDVSITNITAHAGTATSCTAGQPITVELDVTVNFNSPTRYDVGIFVAQDGNPNGTRTSGNGGPASCAVGILPTSAPFLNANFNGCGDGNQDINGGSGQGVIVMTATVPCQVVAGGGGSLAVPFVVTWANNGLQQLLTCTSPNDPYPGTSSKCNVPAGGSATVPILVLPAISITDNKTTTYSGDASTYTVVISNTAGGTLSGAVFKSPAIANLNVTAVHCAVSGGTATCPPGGSVTVAAMQGAGIALPDLPDNGSLTFTIEATVTGNPTTVVNTAEIVISDQSAAAADADTVVPYYLRLEHDGAGVGCAPESVTVKACADATCALLFPGSVTATLSSTTGSWSTNPITFSGGSTAASLTAVSGSAQTVTIGAVPSVSSPGVTRCFNGGAETCAIPFAACPSAACNAPNLSGIVNTYYPGAGSVAAGSTTITVGVATGATTGIAANDLLLVMQMQDEDANWTNTASYGSGTPVAGKYEYAIAAGPVVGGQLTLSTGLANSYTVAAYGSSNGQKTFQVVRVPVYPSATLPAAGLTAQAWNGGTGGVLAFDVTGALNLNNAVVDVSGKGFRGGGGCEWVGDNSTSGLSSSDYRRTSSTTCPSGSRAVGRTNGIKGEGVAGTPRYTYDGSVRVNTGVEGYPNGSTGRGAPGNAGGGGTDDDPANNDENTGGGGGAGYGTGGTGGYGWSAPATPGRGLGGNGIVQSAAKLTLGGGGGAGTSNNGTADGNGLNSSGVAGGGIIMVRTASMTGNATFRANGANNTLLVNNDGNGGGGGGGAILVSAASGIAGLTLSASGGYGGTNDTNGQAAHGPGGGGGGGYAITTSSPASCVVAGGAAGLTTDTGDSYNNTSYGASAGNPGICATSGSLASNIPGMALGSGPCASALHHYAISYPLGNPGVTCEALAVRVTGHDSTDTAVAPPGTQITLSTSPATGGWALKSGAGTFTAPNQYTFGGSETYADFWLTQTTPSTSPHIDIDVTDGSKTDLDGSATEDAKAQFADAVFRFYSDTDGTLATIATQVAGVESASYYLKAVRTDAATGTCTAALQNQTTAVGLGYQCNNPTTCPGSDLLSVTAAETKTISRNNNGSSSSFTSVNMAFDASGYAPFSFNHKDVGQITLLASKTLAADNTKTPPLTAATVMGSSGGFIVKPYGFKLSDRACAAADKTSPSSAVSAFCVAGGTFTGTVTPFYYVNSASTNNYGGVTPSFGQETTAQTVSFVPHALVNPTAAAGGTLSNFTSTATGSFSGTPNTATATMVWPEVGTITVKPDTLDYLGAGDIPAAGRTDSIALAGNVGRFYPKDFALNAGSLTAACVAGGFTYMGQPNLGIAYTLTARNKNDDKTSNYFAAPGGYDNVGTVSLVAENANAGADLGARISGFGTPAPAWVAGEYAVAATGATFSRESAPNGPFDTLAIGVTVADTDAALVNRDMRATTTGACTTATDVATDCDARQIGAATKVRFGMLKVDNASGSDRQDLPVRVAAMYYAGTPVGWAVNSLDTCTALSVAPFTPHAANTGADACFTAGCTSNTAGTTGSIWLHDVGGTSIAQAAAPLAVSVLAAGSGTVTLTRPLLAGTPTPGTLELTLVSPSWLQANSGRNGTAGNYDWNPLGRITFGVYGPPTNKSKFIYIRENY